MSQDLKPALDFDALKKVASAATPGTRRVSGFEVGTSAPSRVVMAEDGYGIAWLHGRSEREHEADAAFLTAFDPPTVLALIELAAARAEGAPAAEGFDIRASIERIGRAHSDAYNQNIGHNTVVAIEAELRAALSPPAAEGKEDPTDGIAGKLMAIYHECANGRPINGGDLEVIEDAATALSHTPAPAAERVAWRWRPRQDPGYGWCVGVIPPAASPERWEIEPLYASPPPGGEG